MEGGWHTYVTASNDKALGLPSQRKKKKNLRLVWQMFVLDRIVGCKMNLYRKVKKFCIVVNFFI
jgi:hypothetical protein